MAQADTQRKVQKFTFVVKTPDVQVREYNLAPGETLEWHRHTQVTDQFYGLDGTVLVETREPPARHEIGVGQNLTITPPTVHRTSNPTAKPCRFLLIQGIGKYDFIKAD